MKQPEAALRELVGQWLDKASADFLAAKHLSGESPQFGAIVAFHCQQAAEKFLKAFLVRHQIEFPKTHDIARLLRGAASVDPAMASLLLDADQLTPFGVETRYPGDAPELLPGGENAAIEAAGRVGRVVTASLEAFLHGGDSTE